MIDNKEQKVLIKVYFYNEFVGLHVLTDEKKILRYVEDHEYLNGKNYILADTDSLKLLGDKYFFKKVLEYFNAAVKVNFITDNDEIESFFEQMKVTGKGCEDKYWKNLYETNRAMNAYYKWA